VDGSHMLSSPWGLFGGAPGGRGGLALHGGAVPFNHGSGMLRKGEIIEVVTAGSGGYGPPAERATADARRDVVEGRIEEGAARAIYRL